MELDFFSLKTMESPGKYLKAERELRNLSLEEVAKFTKIRQHFLKAIEEDRYELLPPGVYVKGFLTLYARYLGLDPYEVIQRYQNYIEDLSISKEKQVELPQKIPSPKKRIGLWLFFALIFAITLFILLFIHHTPHEHIEWVPPPLEEREPPSVRLPPAPSPLPFEENVETQMPNQVEEERISKPKEMEAKDAIGSKAPSFEVLEASMGTGIEREGGRLVLKGKCSEFTCNQRAYFFTRIKTQREGKIAHIWLLEGKEFHRTEIEVKPPAWSVYSYLTLRPHSIGNWRAEVRDGDNVLTSLSFNVTESTDYSIEEKH
jgi:cytoskeletal protein RodZ